MLQGSADWLRKRDQCAITWSQAANALGVGYESRQLYMKRKLKMVPKQESNWRLQEGILREPTIAELYFLRQTPGKLYHPVIQKGYTTFQ